MDIKQLRVILAVAEHGTFTAAADYLNTVQSNISAHIRKLEEELAISIVDRQSGELTAQGKLLADRAQKILSEIDSLKVDMASMHNNVAGPARIGLIGSTASWLVPLLHDQLSKRWPLIKPVYSEGTSRRLAIDVMASRMDIAIISLPNPFHELFTYPLFEEQTVLFVRKTHTLAKETEINLKEIEKFELLLPAHGTYLRHEIDEAAKRVRAQLDSIIEVDSIRLLANLATRGYGPALLPATAIPEFLRDDFSIVRVIGIPPRTVGVTRGRGPNPSAVKTSIIELLAELCNKEGKLPPYTVPIKVNCTGISKRRKNSFLGEPIGSSE